MLRTLAAVAVAAALTGCPASGDPYTIQVNPMVGTTPFSCGATVDGLGTTDSSMWTTDFRMFIHDVAVIDSSGAAVPMTLEADNEWQSEDTALLDFADGAGRCGDMNGATNDLIIGTVPTGTEVAGIEFTVGLPPDMNHIDAATAAPPFNDTGLWWTWSGGFKWIRLDMESEEGVPFYFHHGATGCDGTPDTGFSCTYANETRIVIDSFNPDTQVLNMDIGSLFAGNDFVAPVDFQAGDVVKGCMAFGGDPECQPIFNSLGLNFEDDTAGPAQTVFSAN